MNKAQRIGKSALIGAVSGLAASWIMNQYWNADSKLKEKLQPCKSDQGSGQQQKRASDNPTTKVADTISESVAGRDVPEQKKKAAGAAVHYAFGASMGALYGLLSEIAPVTRAGFGLAYASALWLAADEILVPASSSASRRTNILCQSISKA